VTRLTHPYPLATYPYARDAAEEDYFRAVHYLASSLYLFDAGDEALRALSEAWQRVVDRQGAVLAGTSATSRPS
jgi:hypothetical protein